VTNGTDTTHALPAGIERFGVEPVPAELRTTTWRDLVGVLVGFNLNPLMYVIGALAATSGGLSVWWSAITVGLGTVLGNVTLILAGRVGVDYGLPGQVAMRATFGQLGARGLTSPYRMVATMYWFAAQALAAAIGFRALVEALTGRELGLVPVSVGVGAVAALLAIVGFDAMRLFARVVLPMAVGAVALLVALFLVTDDPAFAPSAVLGSDEFGFGWLGFASFLTVAWGGQASAIPSAADFCRYARSHRDVAIGFICGSGSAAFVAGWVGAYAAIAAESTSPFAAAADVTGSEVLLVLLLLAIVVQCVAVNVINVYTGGLSLVNAVPAAGRFVATLLVGVVAVVLSGFPDLIEEAQDWFTHLGNVAAPLSGVIVADYVLLKRTRLDVVALFEPRGRYRYAGGVNPAAIASVGVGVAVYYALPDAWLKVAWGTGVAIASHVALAWLQARMRPGWRGT
jgi:cytosine permease